MYIQPVEEKNTALEALKRVSPVPPYTTGIPDIAWAAGNQAPAPRAAQPGNEIDFIEIRQGVLPRLDSIPGGDGAFSLTPFQLSGWLEAWQRGIGRHNGSTPVTVIGYSGGQPMFVLPLAVIRRFGGRCLTWCAHQESDYCAPILNSASADMLARLDGEGLLRQIASRIGGIDLVYVPKQPRAVGGTANPFLLPGAVRHHAGAHAMKFLPGENWETGYQRRRSAKTRRRLREKRAALEKLGVISFRVAITEAEAKDLINTCLDAKSGQLEKLGHWDPFSPHGVREFLTSYFSSNVGHSTWAVALEVDGKPAATAFGFRNSSEWLLYQMAMSSGPESRHSPGTHLLMELMRHCTERGVGRLDLALGDESYKAEWCDEHIDLWNSTLAFTARGKVIEKMIRLCAAVRLRLATDPKLYDRAKWLKGMARKLRLPL